MAGILPWAAVLVVIGGAVWWLLSREMAAGRWLLAALLIGHGVVHVLFAVPAPTTADGGAEWPFNLARSWAITSAGLDANTVRIFGLILITVVVVGFSLAALSTVGIIVPSGWWQPIVALSAITSAILLVLSFEPQLVLGRMPTRAAAFGTEPPKATKAARTSTWRGVARCGGSPRRFPSLMPAACRLPPIHPAPQLGSCRL